MNKPGLCQWKLTEPGVFCGPGSSTSLDDTSGKIKICEPIWDIFFKFYPFWGEKIVNLTILCCVNIYDCMLVYNVTFITVRVE